MPTFFPFSNLETGLLFAPDNIQKIKNLPKLDSEEFHEQFSEFES